MNRKIYVGGGTVDQWGTFKRNKRDIIENFENEGNNYILTNNLGGFYNKALIYQNYLDSCNHVLVSYNTIVAEIKGDKFIIYGYYSKTTATHINAFLNFFGLKTLSKKEILNIEDSWQQRKDYISNYVYQRGF